MKRIDALDKWNILSAAMREKGYSLWQFQFGYDCPEGFHAWFWSEGRHDVEVITFDKSVQEAIVKYNGKIL